MTITGTNFGATGPVQVYWDSIHTLPISSTTTTAVGTFVAHLSVPQAISGAHAIIAVGQQSLKWAATWFIVKPATALARAAVTPGSQDVLAGVGFGKQEQVKTYWNKKGGLLLGTTATNALGTFAWSTALTFTAPLSPTGTYNVISVGTTSGDVYTTTVTLTP